MEVKRHGWGQQAMLPHRNTTKANSLPPVPTVQCWYPDLGFPRPLSGMVRNKQLVHKPLHLCHCHHEPRE